MRWLIILLVACQSSVSKEQETCARAAAMFERCEELVTEGSDAKKQNELIVDRWRGLCRAVLTGETKQMLPEVLQSYSVMDEGTKAGLRVAAECTAKATNCVEYAACNK